MKKKLINLFCTLVLMVTMLPMAVFAAETDTGKALQLVDNGTAANISGWNIKNGYNYIYYGQWNGSPVKWRVLDDQTNTGEKGGLFLLSDVLLGTGKYGDVYFNHTYSFSNAWQYGDAQAWCKAFESNNLDKREAAAILETTKSDKRYTSRTYNILFDEAKNILNGDKVFFLSAEEVENGAYGFNGDASRVAYYGGSTAAWWLRSPYLYTPSFAGIVRYYGIVDRETVSFAWAARPAFNLDLDSVLFTSAAVGGDQGNTASSDISEIGNYTGNEWKLTLLDNSRQFNVTETAVSGKPGDIVTLNYTGAVTGANEYISVIIANNSGAQYYGRISQPTNANGQIQIKIPTSLADGTYTLNVFSEQYNGDYKTDYASAFETVTLDIDATAPTLSNGSATRDSQTAATIKFTSDEAGVYYYEVVESGESEPDINTTVAGISCYATEQTISVDNLSEAGASETGTKDIYIVVKDKVGNVSDKLKIEIPAIYTPAEVQGMIQAAQPGDTVTVNLSTGTTKLDKEVFEELTGKDVTLEMRLPGGLSWTVNGQDIPAGTDFTDLDLGVKLNTSGIPVDVINAVTGDKDAVQLTLAHNGEFGFTLTLTAPVGTENKGLWANLYRYDEDAGEMIFETAARVGADGNAALEFTHASQYAIVLDKKSHELPFTDVDTGDWFQTAVEYVYRHDVMNGTSATTFEPHVTLSRAMVAQILYNLEGQPAVTGESNFVDANSHWAANAIAWAKQTGVVVGYEGNMFKPEKAVTREELAQMLYNYANYRGITLPVLGDLSQFPDGNKVSSWAQTAMKWATGLQVINGYEDNTLRPGGSTTRAEAASMIMGIAAMLLK